MTYSMLIYAYLFKMLASLGIGSTFQKEGVHDLVTYSRVGQECLGQTQKQKMPTTIRFIFGNDLINLLKLASKNHA